MADIATPALAQLEEQLAGLGPEERRAKLIELAKAEGGEVDFYGGTTPEDSDPLFEAFEDETGIAVNNFRASVSSVLRRIQEEAAAGHVGADVVLAAGGEHETLVSDGLLASFETPVSSQIVEGGVTEHGIDVYRTIRVPMWNTNRVTPDQYPTSWEQVFEMGPGQVVMDPTDWDWFAAFTQLYLMGEKGMTEQEAMDYWMSVAPNFVVVSGHTLGTQLVSTGEYMISPVTYHHSLPPEDAPVMWEPPLWPVITTGVKVSIMANTDKPASALLLTEFWLTDGQEILYQGGRSPANVDVESAWPAEYNDLTVPLDPELFSGSDAEKWQGLYEQVMAAAGGQG